MNFKERMEIINQLRSVSMPSASVTLKSNVEVDEIFVKSDAVERILKKATNSDKNILVISNSEIEKSIVSDYIRSFIDTSTSIELLQNITENLPYISAKKVVVSETTIVEFVKIMEIIIQSSTNFIFNLNLKSFINVLESIRVLIALEFPNLSHTNIEHLLITSNLLVVFVDRNEDGLYEVQNISKIVSVNSSAVLETIYMPKDKYIKEIAFNEPISNNNVVVQDEQITTVPNDMIVDEQLNTNNIDSSIEPENVNEVENLEEVDSDTLEDKQENVEENITETPEQVETPVKVNKYKLLREKVKNRKHSVD